MAEGQANGASGLHRSAARGTSVRQERRSRCACSRVPAGDDVHLHEAGLGLWACGKCEMLLAKQENANETRQ